MSVESMNASSSLTSVQPAETSSVSQGKAAGTQPVSSISDTGNAQPEMSAEEMQAVVDKLNEFMHNGQRNLNFSVDSDTEETVVKVMDSETQEVIRQFPSEEALKLAKHIDGMMGLIFNDHA
ncbi:flagellar protein FlaG [Amphritea sp. 1_MG-2023]|uniref:flagellar protein FlaG n=1 Tax=Amphritea sp. 1_MG-2023 TaxID=3062670 RepID=UPI0026E28329|nr:flagellar protein FlaG [Amphritea sp. 1_MG-2023]MDO6564698.1 flagellar protein FlaG [Amphritea sp. 1_MG-2023]